MHPSNRWILCLLLALAASLAQRTEAATLSSVININRNGGTATGTFVNNELPSFLLTTTQNRFSIRSTSTDPNFRWEFLLDTQGETPLLVEPTVNLNESLSFSSGPVRIFENNIPLSADRFNPDPVYYLIGRVNGTLHAFQVARWASGPVDRLRFYGVEDVVDLATTSQSPIPEPGAAAIGLIGLTVLLLRRRRA